MRLDSPGAIGAVENKAQAVADVLKPANNPTEHLIRWSDLNGFADVAKRMKRFPGAATGGLHDPDHVIRRDPIIVFNGWGDRVHWEPSLNPAKAPLPGVGFKQLGLMSLYQYGQGSRAVFSVASGPGDWVRSQVTRLDKKLVMDVRRDVECMIAYADAHAAPGVELQFSIDSHSGGTELARAVIAGGKQVDERGEIYDIGSSLAHRFKRSLMVAPPENGIPLAPMHPLVHRHVGFQKGSEFLERNRDKDRMATEVITAWAMIDEVMGPAVSPNYHPTCSIREGANKEDGHIAWMFPGPGHTAMIAGLADVFASVLTTGKLPETAVAWMYPELLWTPIPVVGGLGPPPMAVSGVLKDSAKIMSPREGMISALTQGPQIFWSMMGAAAASLSR